MSKYVLDINSDYAKSIVVFGMMGDKGMSTVFKIDELEELNNDYINKHYDFLQDTAYQRGLNDAWEAARKIIEMTDPPYWEIFNEYKDDLFGKISASEAIEKLKAYEDSNEIKIGDEVKSLDDSGVEIKGFLPWVVTVADEDDDYCQGIDKEGRVHATKKVRACKTGRHFDIVSILEAMKHDDKAFDF